MTTRIRYIGSADAKRITAADFTAAGFPGQAELNWNKANSLEQAVSDDIAILLLAQADFQTVDGMTLGQYLGTGFGGRLLQQAANRTNNIYSTAGADIVIPGCSVTVTVGARPIKIEYGGYLYNLTAANGCIIKLMEGAVLLDQIAMVSGAASEIATKSGIWLPDVKPTVGPHTYDLYLGRSPAGTANCFAASSAPARIAAYEC